MIYKGEHISGKGDAEKLKLIDQSFSMLHSTPTLPNLKMLYKSKTNMFSEGFIWGTGWWIQNSFGFAMGAIPLLTPFWFLIFTELIRCFLGANRGWKKNRSRQWKTGTQIICPLCS